jgi:hypothetical protein
MTEPSEPLRPPADDPAATGRPATAGADLPAGDADGPVGGGPAGRSQVDRFAAASGLRNPVAAARAAGAGALVVEAIVLLLALAPLVRLGTRNNGLSVALILVLTVACVVLVGLLRHPWAWYAALVPQVLLVVAGILHPAFLVLGLLFLLLWGYMLNVRRTVLAPPRRTGPPPA